MKAVPYNMLLHLLLLKVPLGENTDISIEIINSERQDQYFQKILLQLSDWAKMAENH